MRVKIGNRVLEIYQATVPGSKDRIIMLNTYRNEIYSVDCESVQGALFVLNKLLTEGYYDMSKFDYNNDQSDLSWYEFCQSKPETLRAMENV